ncbi:uncharacterized protein LOC132047495 [Lycium ferocissimum]|uniref:uncharacterized protein LOC132047495 n=1 Tax=Lycium ferocissimum TaxID=112874 RepID=UPI002814C8CA|nr:uncharacterized protein LOC132047495 [Lycium ferocissimum]
MGNKEDSQFKKVLKGSWDYTGLIYTTTNLLNQRDIQQTERGLSKNKRWKKIICNNHGCPRWVFIHYLAIHGRLATKDRLIKWNIDCSPTCPLCEAKPKSVQHLLFQCPTAHLVWEKLLMWQKMQRQVLSWDQEQKWAKDHTNRSSAKAEIYRITLSGCIYYIWQERNQRAFQSKRRTAEAIVKMIIQDVHCAGAKKARLAKILQL